MTRDVRGSKNQLTYEPGTSWVFDGQIVEIDGVESTSVVSVRVQSTGEVRHVPVAGLSTVPSGSPSKDVLAISSDEWSRMLTIARDIRALAEHARVPGAVLARVAMTHDISVRHVQRLLAKFRLNPRVSSLAKRKAGRPTATRLLRPEVEGVINHVIRKHYLKREHASQLQITDRVRSICRRCGLPQPSRNTVRRRIQQHNDYDSEMRRLGAKKARQRWEPRPGQFFVERPLDVVQIDHTLVDLMVLSDDRRDVLGRPWLTIAMDVATRVVLGFYLSMDPPSAISVGLCIAHAVLPKAEDALDPGLWPMFGKMQMIHVDNGKDLVSEAIRRGCEEHGIALERRPIGTPHYGGHVERLMGSLMRMVHGLPGTTFSNIREKSDYDSERMAILTLMELNEWMLQRIGRTYHTRTHRALGVPPLIAWERAWRSATGQIALPPPIPRPDDFRLDFLPFQRRRLQRTGIQLWHSRYWSESLACLAHPDRIVQVHYHPHHLERIWIRIADDRIIEAQAVAGPAAGQPRLKAVDASERAHIAAQQDAGFEACDRIENMAASITRAQSRRSHRIAAKKDRWLPKKGPSLDTCLDEASPNVPLDRSSVKVKRFTP